MRTLHRREASFSLLAQSWQAMERQSWVEPAFWTLTMKMRQGGSSGRTPTLKLAFERRSQLSLGACAGGVGSSASRASRPAEYATISYGPH